MQVQLATKVSVKTFERLTEFSKSTEASKASIVDKAINEYIDNNQINILKPKITRGKDGKFKKTK